MKTRSVLLYVFLIALTYGMMESLSFVAYRVVAKKRFSFSESQAQKAQTIRDNRPAPKKVDQKPLVFHPYIGSIHNPKANIPKQNYAGLGVNSFGFIDDNEPIQKRSKDKRIVGIFGGSVSWWLSALGADALRTELAKSPYFKDKEIVIVRTSLGANKQPQQLTTLSYLLSLGAEFDVIINLDGFNEIALPGTSNLKKNINPYFPNYWFDLYEDVGNPAAQTLIREITHFKEKKRSAAALAEKAPFRFSISANTLWSLYDRYLQSKLNTLRLELNTLETEEGEMSFGVSGPEFTLEGEKRYADYAKVWKRASLQMDHLAKANGAKYFHFLQPNQYVPDSKPLGKEERERAYMKKHPFRTEVLAGYPHLRREGGEIKKAGVSYYDLTMMFKGNKEPLYNDTCCHFNLVGNARLGEHIGRVVAKSLKASQAVGSRR